MGAISKGSNGSNKYKEGVKSTADGVEPSGVSGAASGATSGDQSGIKESGKKKSSYRKKIGNLWDNIKGAARGRMKDIFILKAKGVVYLILAIIVIFALIVESIAEDTSKTVSKIISDAFANSVSAAADFFKSTGSLLLASEDELKEVSDSFLKELESKNTSYYKIFSTVYSGKNADTVAKKVKNITTNFSSGETENLDLITDAVLKVSGADSVSDSRSIFEHILRTETYNFNSITWRAYEKSGSGLKKVNMSFQVDNNTKLKYPSNDVNDTNNDKHNLDFFVSMVRPYLQSWHIPFDIMIGTEDSQNASNLNTDLAYEILASAYHEIVMDRYKIETLTRNTNYRVYDKTTTTTTITRQCASYKDTTGSTVKRKKGDKCTQDDYIKGLCKDATLKYRKKNFKYNCLDNLGGYPKSEIDAVIWDDSKCTYGVLINDVRESTSTTKTYCTDTPDKNIKTEKDIRESISTKDTSTYRLDYVVSLTKLFDKVLASDYEFTPYYNYSLENYNKYINKKDDYAKKTVEEFKESEISKSKANEYTHEIEEYYDVKEDENNNNTSWNADNVVENIPSGATRTGSYTSKEVKKTTKVEKIGEVYKDEYIWNDSLEYIRPHSGIYNVNSVKDVTGDDLTDNDENYYEAIYNDQKLNIIDLMNSDNSIYKNYLSDNEEKNSTNNIGITRGALDISYNVLKKDLEELNEKYTNSGISYGQSIGVGSSSTLAGVDLDSIVAAGDVNTAEVTALTNFYNYHSGATSLKDMKQIAQSAGITGIFSDSHWCAMLVSFTLRYVEKVKGITIPIPNFYGCTTFWRDYRSKPGFYDIASSNIKGIPEYINPDSSHIAENWDGIQPGDIVLFRWTGSDGGTARSHTAIVVEVSGSGQDRVIKTLDGNWHGTSYYDSTICENTWKRNNGYYDISKIVSYISISTVLDQAEKGNSW